MNCPRCNGWLEYSPVDNADWCWNCGRLFYKFTPDSEVPKRRASIVGSKKYSLVPEYIRELFIQAGGTMYVRDLSDQMYNLHGTTGRYVRLILTSRAEFRSLGRGWWALDDL